MKKDYIHMAIPETLKEELVKEAKELNISLNAYIRMILSKREKQK